jgi:ribulose-phosphate 3-epimerase
MNQKLIAPSILSADFAKLGQEITDVTAAGADWIHVDVMDGHFVPNLTIGMPVVAALKKFCKIPLDVHLMIDKPEKYIAEFCKAGSDSLTIHVEATDQPDKVLRMIKDLKVKPGISLRPKTALSKIEPLLSQVDLVLVMTVEPGFGGQGFMLDQVAKIDELKKIREEKGYKYLIEVDGGVSDQTVGHLKNADVLVAGSFVFQKPGSIEKYQEQIRKLRA